MSYPSITMYSKPSCVQCTATERWLTSRDIPFDKIDVTKDEAALDFTKSLGYLQAPVIYIDENAHWSGFDPGQLSENLED